MTARVNAWPTTRRLLAAIVREGYATALARDGRIWIRTPYLTWICGFSGDDPSFPHPAELSLPLRYVDQGEEADIEHPSEVLLNSLLPYDRAILDPYCARMHLSLTSIVLADGFRRPPPAAGASGLEWERRIVEGDPLDPVSTDAPSPDKAVFWLASCLGQAQLPLGAREAETDGPYAELLGTPYVPRPPEMVPSGPALTAHSQADPAGFVVGEVHVRLTDTPPVRDDTMLATAWDGERGCIVRGDPGPYVLIDALLELDPSDVPLCRHVPIELTAYIDGLVDAVVPARIWGAVLWMPDGSFVVRDPVPLSDESLHRALVQRHLATLFAWLGEAPWHLVRGAVDRHDRSLWTSATVPYGSPLHQQFEGIETLPGPNPLLR